MQGFHLVEGQVGGKGRQIPLSQTDFAQQGADAHGDQAVESKVRLALAPIRQTSEKAAHPPEFCGPLRTFGGMVLRQVPQGLRRIASAQKGARPGAQFPHPKLFGPRMSLVEIPAGTLVALGLAQQCPAAGFVTGAQILLRIDKTLCH